VTKGGLLEPASGVPDDEQAALSLNTWHLSSACFNACGRTRMSPCISLHVVTLLLCKFERPGLMYPDTVISSFCTYGTACFLVPQQLLPDGMNVNVNLFCLQMRRKHVVPKGFVLAHDELHTCRARLASQNKLVADVLNETSRVVTLKVQ